MIVGAYSLHLYCDAPCCRVKAIDKYNGQTAKDCYVGARSDGWYLKLAVDKAYCPRHARQQRELDHG